MADLEIIGGAPSNYVWAVRIACTEKRVPYKHTQVMPHTPDVDAIHPLGKIPVMRHGDVTLAESRAICVYLERMFDGPPLVPPDPVKAAKVEQWVSLVNTSVDPLWVRQYLAAYIFPGTPDKSPDRARYVDSHWTVTECRHEEWEPTRTVPPKSGTPPILTWPNSSRWTIRRWRSRHA